jgi:3-isopropylmalate/(R)-2-methylmalate dehydratase small subunit
MLPIVLPENIIETLFQKVFVKEAYHLTVDLESQTIKDDEGLTIPFGIDPFRKKCLLEGLDDVALTLQHEDKIRSYEELKLKNLP